MYYRQMRRSQGDPPDAETTLPRQDAERIADVLQALVAPNRLRILARLSRSPCCVADITLAVGMEQSAVSHHLRALRHAQIVSAHKRGRRVFYVLRNDQIRALLNTMTAQEWASPPARHTVSRRSPDVTYIIAEPCIDVKDKSCIDVCPVDCIHEYDRMLVIDPEECIDCGACEPECPVEAIFPEDALPDKWEPFVKINYAYPDVELINNLVDQYATEHDVQNSPPAS
jgi:DNA-binding transcriptional ArsR family regulator